jgi:hypothetical protein
MSSDVSTRTRRGRLLRYSLRTLLVFVTLMAVTIAFRASQVSRQRRAAQAIESAGGMVGYFDEGWWPLRGYGRVPLDDSATSWLREFFGLRRPGEVYLKGPGITDQTVREYVLPLPTIAWLGLTETSVSHEGLTQLAAMPDLNLVFLRSDARHDKLILELGQPTQMEFQAVPLQECVAYLVDLHGIPMEIDKVAVPAEKWDHRSQFSATIKNKTLGDALDLLLAPHDLGWIVSGGNLTITKREVQDEHRALVDQMRAKLPRVKELVID